jgi:hypothetical protein
LAELFYHQVFAALRGAAVSYVVVGGVAVNLQGVPRFTADLDLAVAIGPGLPAAARALHGLGLEPRLPIDPQQLADEATVRGWVAERNLQALTFHDPREPLREVDLVISGPVPFEEIERSAERVEAGGLTVAVASIPTLIRMKEGTGRAQDASDVEALRRVLEMSHGR